MALSPELVLVDPELAVRARASLPDPPDALAARLRVPTAHVVVRTSTPPVRRPSKTKLLVGVAAAIVVTMLLADVRVEVGKNGASAELTSAEPSPVPPTVPRAVPPTRPPTSSGSSGPTPRTRASISRRLAWAPVEGVSGYRVELFRGAKRVFATNTSVAFVTIPGRWKTQGARRSLRPGEYRWYVWPVTAGQRSASAIVQASLVIPPS